MAQKTIGGYLLLLDEEEIECKYSASLSLCVGGMMAFAYPDVRIPLRDELKLLESIERDLQRLIEAKRKAVEKLDSRRARKG